MTGQMREKLAAGLRAMPAGRRGRVAALAVLLACLLLLPVGMGGNRSVPPAGWGEALVDSYCLGALRRAQDAYLVTQALDSAIALARSAETSAGVFGVGASVSPGECLAPLHDSVKTLSDLLTSAILLLMVEKQAMGVLSWLCLKLLLPLGLLLLLPSLLRPGRGANLRRAGFLLCKGAVALWLLLPLTAALCNGVDSRWLTPRYNAHVERVKQEMASIFNLPPDAVRDAGLGAVALRAVAGLMPEKGGSIAATVRGLFGRVKNAALHPGDLISLLTVLFSQIAVIVYVTPGIVFLFFLGLWRIVLRRD